MHSKMGCFFQIMKMLINLYWIALNSWTVRETFVNNKKMLKETHNTEDWRHHYMSYVFQNATQAGTVKESSFLKNYRNSRHSSSSINVTYNISNQTGN